MLKSEFIERTGYTPDAQEYHYIEESYYESELPTKDEFCKQWLKDKRSGKWDMELKFRVMLDAQKAEYEEKIAELRENKDFWHEQFEKQRTETKELTATVIRQNQILEAVKRRTERLAAVFEES